MHWTDSSPAAFQTHLYYDFIAQFNYRRRKLKLSEKKTAKLMGISVSRLRKILDDPSSLTFRQMILMCRAIDLKLGLVVYSSTPSPIHGAVFDECWKKMKRPSDLFQVNRK